MFFKKALCKLKVGSEVSTLVLMCFGRGRLGHTIKANFKTFQNVDLDILIFYKSVGD